MTRLRILPGVTWHWGSKDGGPESHVYMYGLECRTLASLLVLRFEDGSREAYHSHAFNAVSRILEGALMEEIWQGDTDFHMDYERRWIRTTRSCCHKVTSFGRTWVLSLRGPWDRQGWVDIDEATGVATVLRSGRVAA